MGGGSPHALIAAGYRQLLLTGPTCMALLTRAFMGMRVSFAVLACSFELLPSKIFGALLGFAHAYCFRVRCKGSELSVAE